MSYYLFHRSKFINWSNEKNPRERYYSVYTATKLQVLRKMYTIEFYSGELPLHFRVWKQGYEIEVKFSFFLLYDYLRAILGKNGHAIRRKYISSSFWSSIYTPSSLHQLQKWFTSEAFEPKLDNFYWFQPIQGWIFEFSFRILWKCRG